VSLAHRGVLVLDELGEFPRHLLDALRQPLEEGVVVVARRGMTCVFPSEVQLVAATNPCPCGFRGDRHQPCTCSASAVGRYRCKLSGPLLDRFDLRVPVGRPDPTSFFNTTPESSASVRSRVAQARAIQVERGALNRFLTWDALESQPMTQESRLLLRQAFGRIGGRGYQRVRRVARTIADLDASDVVDEAHVAEALTFRQDP